jgi:hypothetical protein
MMGWNHDTIRDVDWALGASMMFRAEALRQVGYFDEGFRLYCEDIDLCYRLWKNGWAVYYYPEAIVIHDHQANSDKRLLSLHTFWHYQSMLRYFYKHGVSGFRRPPSRLDNAIAHRAQR